MNQIALCDWLPKRARWSHLACLGLPAVSHKKNFPESRKRNPLLTKFVRLRWLDIGLVLFFISVHKPTKNELGQYPAILTSHLVNNPNTLSYNNYLQLYKKFHNGEANLLKSHTINRGSIGCLKYKRLRTTTTFICTIKPE